MWSELFHVLQKIWDRWMRKPTRNINPPSGFHLVGVEEKPCPLSGLQLKPKEREIKHIFLHCTASPDDLDVGVEDIRAWHLERGWNDIGYHFVIRRSGCFEVGRSIEIPGAHARGYNTHSIGIVWVGQDDPSDEQRESIDLILTHGCFLNQLQAQDILAHWEVNPKKTCPNLDMDSVRMRVENKLKQAREGI